MQVSSSSEPAFYHQVIQFAEWRKAMQDELKALKDNHTWSIVPLPKGKQAIGCRWVYKTKYNLDGTVERHKARLVAKGYTQREGVDFLETFSPVAKPTTIKLVLALTTSQDWHIVQLDINNAFLNRDLEEEEYMEIPHGYDVKGYCMAKQVCKLPKSIYGLRQASRQWYSKISKSLMASSFRQSKSDYSFFLKGSGKNTTSLLIYVDDIIIVGPSHQEIEAIKTFLSTAFKLKGLGTLKYFLGLEIARFNQGIVLCQRNYALQLLDDAKLLGAKSNDTPIDSRQHLSIDHIDVPRHVSTSHHLCRA